MHAPHLLVALAASAASQHVLSASTSNATDSPSPSPRSGLRFLYQNDLDWRRAKAGKKRAYVLHTLPMRGYAEATAACAALGEQLADADTALADRRGLRRQLAFLQLEGSLRNSQTFWAATEETLQWDGSKLVRVSNAAATGATADDVDAGSRRARSKRPSTREGMPLQPLPLCTQSAPYSTINATDASSRWTVEAQSDALTFQGYRDALSFRFGALPYANVPQRFAHSSLHSQSSGTVHAFGTDNSSACPQGYGSWKEVCNVQNVFTTYLPLASDPAPTLRPVMFWIHGGGFTSGSGLDPNFLGGQLASRSDVVVVTPNYRLGMLGWMALNDEYAGNYGLGDLVTALQWVQKHIRAFGGDPDNVTIFGQSAGAILVENLLASPRAAGLFHAAIIQSGWPLDAANARANTSAAAPAYLAKAAQLGCSSDTGDIDAIVTCLRALPAAKFIPYAGGNRPTLDGEYVTSRQLDMRPPANATRHVNRVPTIMGFMRDELGSLGVVPLLGKSLSQSLADAGVSPNNRAIVKNRSDIFPVMPNTRYGVQNLSVTVATDANKPSRRCGAEASLYTFAKNGVFPAVYGYTFDTRAYQIPEYDPYDWCNPKSDAALAAGTYGMCHSGDLLPVFNTYGWHGYEYRDSHDLAWSAAIADQWTAFARWHMPSPQEDYMATRGYTRPNKRWKLVKSSKGEYQILSLGPKQYMRDLAQKKAQCDAFGLGLSYIIDAMAVQDTG
ncbi:alpha/beta-hydrolase [Tilletiaria anomala UBC 951]|uniref:Alpha/beta-hydrolase n=1 Tax=Tilletiaria anomala (strain ATCC 24038 / CBS 436.72 / UBC 951) TaxID=1037660 RepID=A0A066VA27_TILAU|nr:alpha/beta-hydrolase [Tilletiaria anomala UBC 951]KDN35619.1 alpha/beta-hydrolase [Tilletiaria anomala UBC 951]